VEVKRGGITSWKWGKLISMAIWWKGDKKDGSTRGRWSNWAKFFPGRIKFGSETVWEEKEPIKEEEGEGGRGEGTSRWRDNSNM
jgi:hypothetical protein